MYTGRDGGRKPGFEDRLDALRIHHGNFDRKRSLFGNEPVKGGLFTGSEPTVIRRQHREDKNLTLDAACTASDTPPWSSALRRIVNRRVSIRC